MELSFLVVTLTLSSAAGLTLDNEAINDLSEEDQTLVQNEVNKFLDTAGRKIVSSLKGKNSRALNDEDNVDVERVHPNVQEINMRPASATARYYHSQQWPIKNPASCALITWIKWALQTMKLVYERGLDILRSQGSLN